GSLVSGLVWLPVFLQNSYGEKLIDWIDTGDGGFFSWIGPIFQAIAAWITMICLLPVESAQLPIIIASGAVMLIFFIWVIPILTRGVKFQLKQPETRLMTEMFVGVVIAAIALFFVFTYFFGIDLTRGARYNFVYFPAVIILVGASLAVCWDNRWVNTPRVRLDGKQAVAIIWLMGFVSAVTVICNLGYQKYYRPDLFVQVIQQKSQVPVLIATTQKTHVQIGEIMGVGREFKLASPLSSPFPKPQFLLAHQDKDPKTSTAILQQTFKSLPRPFDLWLVNFYAPVEVNNCVADSQSLPDVDGYGYKLYHCE
ncbi:MAG: glycosyltransferase, partial [Nostocaceae cyanobacterium]|nr:glycosyltransferase [Nostocaceae cyanobacterium]